jgi:hypothetical protein
MDRDYFWVSERCVLGLMIRSPVAKKSRPTIAGLPRGVDVVADIGVASALERARKTHRLGRARGPVHHWSSASSRPTVEYLPFDVTDDRRRAK